MSAFDAKRPDEIRLMSCDFKRNLGASETIATGSVKVIAPDDATETDLPTMRVGDAYIVGTEVLQLIQGGIDGQTYTLLFAVTTSEGQRIVAPRDLPVSRII